MKQKLSKRFEEIFQINSKKFLSQDEIQIQNTLAALLRNAAINHLQHSSDIVAKSFRGEHLNMTLSSSSYKTFLKEQGKSGCWATYIEAAALGELLKINVVVCSEKSEKGIAIRDPQDICIYRCADEDAPTVYLHNINNLHWYVNSNTLGQGNCLYNAFAQELQRLCCKENQEILQQKPIKKEFINAEVFFAKSKDSSLNKVSLSKFNMFAPRTSNDEQTITHQLEVEATIQASSIQAIITKQPTPSQLEQEFFAEKARIAQLPLMEQQQIINDYQLALKLAREEFVKTTTLFINNVTPSQSTFSIR